MQLDRTASSARGAGTPSGAPGSRPATSSKPWPASSPDQELRARLADATSKAADQFDPGRLDEAPRS